jgi:hypothetical protein
MLLHEPIQHNGPIYLYLKNEHFAETWTSGGLVPLGKASDYRSSQRGGTMTPDEVLQDRVIGASRQLQQQFVHVHGGEEVFFYDNIGDYVSDDGKRMFGKIPSFRVDRYEEDAQILCASTVGSAAIMRRLKKTRAVVIERPGDLIAVLDEQIGMPSRAGGVRYTVGQDRSHFLKGLADAWQYEYRITWLNKPAQTLQVNIPGGLARHVRVA